jgi:hypothetical protein
MALLSTLAQFICPITHTMHSHWPGDVTIHMFEHFQFLSDTFFFTTFFFTTFFFIETNQNFC